MDFGFWITIIVILIIWVMYVLMVLNKRKERLKANMEQVLKDARKDDLKELTGTLWWVYSKEFNSIGATANIEDFKWMTEQLEYIGIARTTGGVIDEWYI